MSVPYLDPQAPGFSIRSAEVLAAREQHWYARTPFGVAILRYEDANELQNDKRLYQGTRRWPELNGIVSGPLAQWWPDMIMSLEGQDHLRLRKLANPAFKPRIIEALTPEFTALAVELVDAFADRGHTEFMAEFAEPYSARVITRLLGMNEDVWPELATCATQMGLVFSVTIRDDLPLIEAGLAGVLDMSRELIERRRHDIRDDVISNLVQASFEGQQITEHELLLMVSFLVFAGFDTTRNQLGLAMQTFAEHQDQWQLLAAQPELGRTAVEEVMRVNPTITWFSREVNTTFTYRDLDLTEGMVVHIYNIPVGSDPRRFDPLEFDITQQRAPHFGFGGGIHHCLGHYVARVDMREALTVLAQRIPAFRIGEGADFLPDSGNTGPTRLPLVF